MNPVKMLDAEAYIDAVAPLAGFTPQPAMREGIAANLRRIVDFAAVFIEDPAVQKTEPLFAPFQGPADEG
ncbi:MAG: hypothetical protein AB7F74_25205 [Parvibaculaceae bacterium]